MSANNNQENASQEVPDEQAALQIQQNTINQEEDEQEAAFNALPVHRVEANSTVNCLLSIVPPIELPPPGSETICVVCQETLLSREADIRRLACPGNHLHHSDCIIQWLRSPPQPTPQNRFPTPTCPECRAPFRIVWDNPPRERHPMLDYDWAEDVPAGFQHRPARLVDIFDIIQDIDDFDLELVHDDGRPVLPDQE